MKIFFCTLVFILLAPSIKCIASSNVTEEEDTLTFGPVSEFVNYLGDSYGLNVVSLTSDAGVLSYDLGGYWQGKLRAFRIENNGQITYGNELTFSTTFGYDEGGKVIRLTDTKFLLAYYDNFVFRCVVGTVNNDLSIQLGPTKLFSINQSLYLYSVDVFSENKFIIAYREPDFYKGECVIGLIDNDNITFGSIYTFTSSFITDGGRISVCCLDESKFVIGYAPYSVGTVRAGSVNNDTLVTFGGEYQFELSSDEVYYIDMTELSADQFAIAYGYQYNVFSGTLKIGEVTAGDEINLGAHYIFQEGETRNIKIKELKKDKLLICYNDSVSKIKEASILQDSVTFGDPIVFNDSMYFDSPTAITVFDSSEFGLAFGVEGSYKGVMRLGFTTTDQNVAVIDLNDGNKFSVFPVPAVNYLQIRTTPAFSGTIKIFNGLGILVNQFDLIGSTQFTMNVSAFTSGLYFIRSEDKDIFSETPFIITK